MEYDDSRFENSCGQFLDAQERCVLDLACGTGRLTNYATHELVKV